MAVTQCTHKLSFSTVLIQHAVKPIIGPRLLPVPPDPLTNAGEWLQELLTEFLMGK
jgi:hypothetical protein